MMIERQIKKLEGLFLDLQRRMDSLESKTRAVPTEKISEMTAAGNSALTDLTEISRPDGSGGWNTFSVTEQDRVSLVKSQLLQGSFSANPQIISGASVATLLQSAYNGGNSVPGSVVISGVELSITMTILDAIIELSNPITPNFTSGAQAFLLGGSVFKTGEESPGDGTIIKLVSNALNDKTRVSISTSTTGVFTAVVSWFYIISTPPLENKNEKNKK